MRLLTTLILAIYANPLLAAPTPAQPHREFVSACVQVFDQSSDVGAQAVGKTICECTVKESKHQGATLASLKAETQKIKADPKYKISDPKLLAAFQYCTIELLREH